jgi:hypothetical protein
MESFIGQILGDNGQPIGEVEGAYRSISSPRLPVWAGEFGVPPNLRVEAGGAYVLDIEGGPRLPVVIGEVRMWGGSPGVAEFASRGSPLPRG